MRQSNIPVAQSIVTLCKRKDITNVVISPGSRNAPLTISFTEDTTINAYSIVDERCAAFVALGMAQQLKKPVALVCTSGSALLNYYPAIAEAFYSDIPLVIISADRPVERIDIGDGQTIRQKNVFENHILYSANLYSEAFPVQEPLDGKLKQKQWESHRHNEQEINKALNIAIELNGPVHINVPFYEPLYGMETIESQEVFEVLPNFKPKTIDSAELDSYKNIWNSAKRKLVLIGVQSPNAIPQECLELLANDPSVVVMTETTSNVHHDSFLSSIDTIIAPIEKQEDAKQWFEKLQPDVLLTFGGFIVSKKIKAFLREYQPKHHWHVDTKKAYDTFFCLERHFKVTVKDFLPKFLDNTPLPESNYASFWNSVKEQRSQAQKEYLKVIPFSDFTAYEQVLESLPHESILHLSNSSTIRYAQLFQIDASIDVYCNRGTSGIDGSSSTAVGAAMATKKYNTLVTGDLSFFYDSNALWNNYIPSTFRIILINNSGGGIFRILPGDKSSPNYETFFETTHKLNADKLCEMYGFEYSKACSAKEIHSQLSNFFDSSHKPKLLEIETPRTLNDKILLDYFKAIKK